MIFGSQPTYEQTSIREISRLRGSIVYLRPICWEGYLFLMTIIAVLLHGLWPTHLEDGVLAHDRRVPLCSLAVFAAAILVLRNGHDDGLLAVDTAPLNRQQRVQHLTGLLLRRIHHLHLLIRHECWPLDTTMHEQPIVHIESHVPTYMSMYYTRIAIVTNPPRSLQFTTPLQIRENRDNFSNSCK